MGRYRTSLGLTERSATARGRAAVAAVIALCICLGATTAAHAYKAECSWGGGITLTYDFKNGTSDIAGSGEQQMIGEATAVWGKVANVSLRKRIFLEPVYKWISWQTGDHGDGLPFGGDGLNEGEVSHNIGFCTNANEIHFSDSYFWGTVTNSAQRDLYQYAVHESGHALGLGDSSDPQAIMYPQLNVAWSGIPRLGWDDIAGVQALYGRQNGVYHQSNTNTNSSPSNSFLSQNLGDIPLAGDWNGDGQDSPGEYRPSNQTFYLRNESSTGGAEYTFVFGSGVNGAGSAGDRPVVGDWNGDGIDTVGVYRPSNGAYYLRNSNSAGAPFTVFGFGNTEDLPIAGDWNEDGIDTIGVYRPSNGTFYMKNANNGTPPVDYTIPFGNSGTDDRPVVGDWNASGTDTIGIYRLSNATFYLSNTNAQVPPDIVFPFGVNSEGVKLMNRLPVAGDWNGDHQTTVGLYQN